MPAVGLALVVVGIIGATVLAITAAGRPGRAIDSFARAAVGCTTTLDFTETGTFYVYQERGGDLDEPSTGCEPVADAAPFEFQMSAPEGDAVAAFRETTITYERDGAVGSSVARIDIDTAGEYTIAVTSDDVSDVAAVGRDPDEGVAALWWAAVLVGVLGVAVGVVLLMVGRRQRQRVVHTAPASEPGTWPPQPPSVAAPVVAPSESPDPTASDPTATSPWAPPEAPGRRDV